MTHKAIVNQISRIRERANKFIEAELKAHGVQGILPAHGVVLNTLFTHENPVPQKTIVTESKRVKSTVTGVIKTLERHGSVTRDVAPDDARSFLVSLTKKGQALKPVMEGISTKLIQGIFAGIEKEEATLLVASLTKIEQNLTHLH